MDRIKASWRAGEVLRAEVIHVLRNHHDTMPGCERDRPGIDRVRVRLEEGREAVLELWSRTGQDIAPQGEIVLRLSNDMLYWSPGTDGWEDDRRAA